MFRCGKGTTWEGGVRVPGIISHKQLRPGVHSTVFSHMDLLPLSKHLFLFVASATFKPKMLVSVLRYADGDSWTDLSLTRGKDTCLLYYPSEPDPKIGPFAIRFIEKRV